MVYSQSYAIKYQKQILAKIPLIFEKSTKSHTFSIEVIISNINSNIDKINDNDRSVKLTRLVLKYLESKELIADEELTFLKRKLKSKKSSVDNYVPTDDEMKETLSKLSDKMKLMYLMYLVSGMRKVEGEYLLTNFHKLKTQQYDGFVKISMNYLRKTKNSYFCYLPLEVYSKLSLDHKQLSVSSLEKEIKRKKLIPIKYCRKWFYTKCIELGIPESIADYYQGRVSNSVGGNHYLSRQMLADKYYKEKLIDYLNTFISVFCDGCVSNRRSAHIILEA